MKFKYEVTMGYAFFKEFKNSTHISQIQNQISAVYTTMFLNAVLHNQIPRICITVDKNTGEIIDGIKRVSALSLLYMSDTERMFHSHIMYRAMSDEFRYTGYKPEDVYDTFTMISICDNLRAEITSENKEDTEKCINNLRHCNTVFQNLVISVCEVSFESKEEKEILRENINGKLK